MPDPERRLHRLLRMALTLGILVLALLFSYFVPVIPYMPATAEEVRRWGVISGIVQVQLTFAEWLETVYRVRQNLSKAK
jgi:hypothetical protein